VLRRPWEQLFPNSSGSITWHPAPHAIAC
jgi:hypothetical protein